MPGLAAGRPDKAVAAIGRRRLRNQGILSPRPDGPEAVVARLGAVQAQDYLGALWAVGLRLKAARESEVERALADRRIVRTWPLRGTLHFVAAADVRWMLALLAPRMIALSAGRHRQLGLDEETFARSRDACVRALEGGRQLPRDALYRALESEGISTAGQRGIHILGRLAQEGLLCFGARQGKQHTFTLLAEWLPPASAPGGLLARDEALSELARRYFTSRGPATLPDFAWWSGLTLADARAGAESARPHLTPQVIAGETYWRPPRQPAVNRAPSAACLLPAFDVYLVGYTDRSAVLSPEHVRQINAGGGILSPTIVIDGQVAGTWKRALKKGAVVITPAWFASPKPPQVRAFTLAAERYGAFLGLPVELA
jgi:hypothetical protein